MNETDIQERISDIIADIQDLATDADLSTGEVLINVALEIIRESTGCEHLTGKDKAREIAQFLAVVQQKAEAS